MNPKLKINMKTYKQNIAIMAIWWRHSKEGSLMDVDVESFLFFLLLLLSFLDLFFSTSEFEKSLSLSSDRLSILSLEWSLVSRSERLSFFWRFRSLDFDSALELFALFRCLSRHFSRSFWSSLLVGLFCSFWILCRWLVCELAVEYPVSFREFLSFLQNKSLF